MIDLPVTHEELSFLVGVHRVSITCRRLIRLAHSTLRDSEH